MNRNYFDQDGHSLTRETVQKIPPEKLRDYTDIPVNILPTHDALYEAIAEIMIETIVSKKGKKTTSSVKIIR